MEYLVYWAFSGIVCCTIGELVNAYRHNYKDSDWVEVIVFGTVFGPLIAPVLIWALWRD